MKMTGFLYKDIFVSVLLLFQTDISNIAKKPFFFIENNKGADLKSLYIHTVQIAQCHLHSM